ncbi:uncharacterized protein [Littorina saxatilis]|uniref:uncharacterized protein n=1 Tax=Littorina saxatilis TaxID=31220 RepID=UPI0038B49B14
MQKALDGLDRYCKNWGLSVNIEKTKIGFFSRGKIRNIPNFVLNGVPVQVVWDYVYLGVLFNYNNKFHNAMKRQCLIGNRAMFSLIRKCRKLNLPIDVQLDLFEKCVHPILLYGCEVWGYDSLDILSRFQLRFLKMLLDVYKTTPTCMVYGELGRYPIRIEVQCQLLVYWYKLMKEMNDGANKMSCLMLKLHLKLYHVQNVKLPWLSHVNTMLNKLGLSYLWTTQSLAVSGFKNVVKQRLRDQFLQEWNTDVNANSLCFNYRIYKKDFCLERYLLCLPRKLQVKLAKFRTSNHKLPIHQHRFFNVPRNERLCDMCDKNELGDEFHYLFSCTDESIVSERRKLISPYYRSHPNCLKYEQLMNCKSKIKLMKLARFVAHVMILVC